MPSRETLVSLFGERSPVDPIGRVTPFFDLAAVVLRRAGQLMCGLQGHEDLVQFDRGRMFLRCVTCGRDTPGWDVSGTMNLPRPNLPTARVVDAPKLPVRRAA